MREKIDLFSKGIFTYEKPELRLSVSEINVAIESGGSSQGSFVVFASNKASIKGMVYSPQDIISFENKTFFGNDNVITYKIDATCLENGDRINTDIFLITELGEYSVPVRIKVRAQACIAGDEKITDLFQFANLARYNWSAAKNLFKTDEFERLISDVEPQALGIYEVLKESPNISMAMEEFLVCVHKKTNITVTADMPEVIVEKLSDLQPDDRDNPMISIKLTKSTWGYTRLNIAFSGSFLPSFHRPVWGEDFSENTFILNVPIDTEKLKPGANTGSIEITYPGGSIDIPVKIGRGAAAIGLDAERAKQKKLLFSLVDDYINYRRGILSRSGFGAVADRYMLDLAQFDGLKIDAALIRAYVLTVSGKKVQALAQLETISKDVENENVDITYYAIYQYLLTIAGTDEADYINKSDLLLTLYQREKNPFLYVLYMKLDKRHRISNHQRFEALRSCSADRPVPRIVLLEAVQLLNEEPTLMRSFQGFELKVLYFGIKYDLLNTGAITQAAYLASKEKKTSRLGFAILKGAYSKISSTDVLEAYCQYIVTNRTEETLFIKDFEAYRILCLGVESQLAVRDIYEHCLACAGDGTESPLPLSVVNFFADSAKLEEKYQTALYVNIVLYHFKYAQTNLSLMSDMKSYALQRLHSGSLTRSVCVLYNRLLVPEELSDKDKTALPVVVFKHRIKVLSKAASVIVIHRGLKDQKQHELKNGVAYADIISKEYSVVAVDDNGDYITNAEIELTPMITNRALVDCCIEHCDNDYRVMFCRFGEKCADGINDKNAGLVRQVLDCDILERRLANRCRLGLVDYYYDNLEGELLENYLVKIDMSSIGIKERGFCIDMMIYRELYSLALKNIELYGCHRVDLKWFEKLLTCFVENDSKSDKQGLLTDYCFYVFEKKRAGEAILRYLVKYYVGDIADMYKIWLSAQDAGIDTLDIEEKLLETILFTESEVLYAKDIFKHYYGHSTPGKLANAFISYYAYGYLTYDRAPEAETIELIRSENERHEREVYTIALLKYYSSLPTLEEKAAEFVKRKIYELEGKGIVYPFFKDFSRFMRIPSSIEDKYFVEYHTDPGKHVRIHYCLVSAKGDDTYIVEDMKDLGYGIFSKDIVLFYGEVLQYYISEEDENGGNITESGQVSLEPDVFEGDDSVYHRLNLIVTAREMKDNRTMQKLLDSYIRKDYMCRHLFKPLL